MSQNDEKTKNRSKNQTKEKENLEIMLNNNSESYKIMKNQKVKIDECGKKKSLINYEEIKNDDEDIPHPKTRKRSNSVDLYKKHKREREKKNKMNKESNKSIKVNNIQPPQENSNNNTNNNRKSSKNLNCKGKKVSFPKNFVTIIDVESYKQFNIENTSKDPFEDLEFLNNIHNINNYNINININNNKDEDDGKERVNCSCLIY